MRKTETTKEKSEGSTLGLPAAHQTAGRTIQLDSVELALTEHNRPAAIALARQSHTFAGGTTHVNTCVTPDPFTDTRQRPCGTT